MIIGRRPTVEIDESGPDPVVVDDHEAVDGRDARDRGWDAAVHTPKSEKTGAIAPATRSNRPALPTNVAAANFT